MNEKKEKEFVDYISLLYKTSPGDARVSFLATFWTCYSVMDVSDRSLCILSILKLISHTGTEKFEDFEDFASFLKENPIYKEQ